MAKKVALTTLGCKLNQYETEALEQLFEANGFEIVDFREKADIYIINTCTVTGKADGTSRKFLRQALRANSNALIIATGCYAQLHPDEIVRQIPGVDLIVGNQDKSKIVQLVCQHEKHSETKIFHTELTKGLPCDNLYVSDFSHRTRAFLKIQDGCDYECTYCAVRLARGPSRSRDIGKVIQQASDLASAGYKEIVLTGVHIGLYGNDLDENADFGKLCKKLTGIQNLERIRISSLEPNELTDDLIDLTANSDRICRHYHLPLQSGDDEILHQMNRKYDSNLFIERVEKLLEKVPHCCLGADVIVGFPGESEEHFQNTYNLLDKLPFAYFHIFTYSDRPNTPSSQMPNKINPKVKKDRVNRLKKLRAKKQKIFHQQFIGKTVHVLYEHRRDRQTGLLTGLSDNYVRVLLDGDDSLMNEIVPVRIIEIKKGKIYGKLAN